MENCLIGRTGNPYNGKCGVGAYKQGILFSETKNNAIAIASAKVLATFDTLQSQTGSKRLHYINFEKFVPGETTVGSYKSDNGAETKTSEVKAPNKIEVFGDDCSLRSLYSYFKDQKSGFVFFTMSNGKIEGKEETDGTISQIAVSISAIVKDGTFEVPRIIELTISERENYMDKQISINPDFSIVELEAQNVVDLKLVQISNSNVSLVVSATTICGAAIDSLATGAGNFFLAYNVTDGAAIVITGVTKSGNDYTLTFADQVGADTIKVWYAQPAVSSELYELLEENALTVTLAD